MRNDREAPGRRLFSGEQEGPETHQTWQNARRYRLPCAARSSV